MTLDDLRMEGKGLTLKAPTGDKYWDILFHFQGILEESISLQLSKSKHTIVILIHMLLKYGVDSIKAKVSNSISCDILLEIVWRHYIHHILLDDMQLYAACNAPAWDETAKVNWMGRTKYLFFGGRYIGGYTVGNHVLWGAQWLSGGVLDLRLRGRGFKPHQHHCVVSLSKTIDPSLVLVQPRKTHPFTTERLLMGRKESNQTNKQTMFYGSAPTSTYNLLNFPIIYPTIYLPKWTFWIQLQ